MSYIAEYLHGDMDEEEYQFLAARFNRQERAFEREMDFEPEESEESEEEEDDEG